MGERQWWRALGCDEQTYIFSCCSVWCARRPTHTRTPAWLQNDQGQVRAHIPLDPDNAVVGQQPVLPYGHTFEYYSGTDLDTPSGLQAGQLLVSCLGIRTILGFRVGSVRVFSISQSHIYL